LSPAPTRTTTGEYVGKIYFETKPHHRFIVVQEIAIAPTGLEARNRPEMPQASGYGYSREGAIG